MFYDPKDWFWIIGSDEWTAYSSATQGMVDAATVDPERMTRIDSMESLIGVLRAANVPPYHTVASYRIVRRLEEAGFAEAALQVIDAPENAVLKARFYTLGAIPADDTEAIALVEAAGADPAVILAPG